MLTRLRDAAAGAELHAFEVVDRCCREARDEHRRLCGDIDSYRREALAAVLADDLETAVSLTRLGAGAESDRRVAWETYRHSVELLLNLVRRSLREVGPEVRHLPHAG